MDLGTVKARRQDADVAVTWRKDHMAALLPASRQTRADGLSVAPYGLAAKSASETPVMPTNRAAKTRRLKKADREVDFFFMKWFMK